MPGYKSMDQVQTYDWTETDSRDIEVIVHGMSLAH